MLVAVKIGVLGVTLAFVFVLFVLLDALDAMHASSREEERTCTDEFNRTHTDGYCITMPYVADDGLINRLTEAKEQ